MSPNIWFFNELSDIGYLYKHLLPEKYYVLKTQYNKEFNRYEPVGDVPSGKKTLIIKLIDQKRRLVVRENKWEEFALEDSGNFGISQTFFNTVKYFQDLGFYILFDKVIEAPILSHRKLAVRYTSKLKEVQIDTSKIAFATNNYFNKGTTYEVYDKTKLKVIFIPFFVYLSHIIAVKYDSKLFSLKDILSKEKKFPFIIPVRKGRVGRLFLLSSLFENNILQNCKWSLSSYYTNKNIDYSRIKNFADFYKINSDSFISKEITKKEGGYSYFENDEFLKNRNKTSFFDENGYNVNEIAKGIQLPDFKEWIDSKVHICCETYTSDNYNAGVRPTVNIKSILHITEKIFKPIRTATPFTVLGQKKSLDLLKSYGFKTFSTVIDESYDDIEVNYERLSVSASVLSKNHKVSTTDLKFFNKIERVITESIKLLEYANKEEVKEITAHNFYLIRNSNFFKNKFKDEVYLTLNKLF